MADVNGFRNDKNPLESVDEDIKVEVPIPAGRPPDEDIINMYQRTLANDSEDFIIETNHNTALINLKNDNFFMNELSDDDTSSIYHDSEDDDNDEVEEEEEVSDDLGDNPIRRLLMSTENTQRHCREPDNDYDNDHALYALRPDDEDSEFYPYKQLISNKTKQRRRNFSSSSSSSKSNDRSRLNIDFDCNPFGEIVITHGSTCGSEQNTLYYLDKNRQGRKKEQNKIAATRYRIKRKQQIEAVINEEKILGKRNDELKRNIAVLLREIKLVKSLLREIYHCCVTDGSGQCSFHKYSSNTSA